MITAKNNIKSLIITIIAVVFTILTISYIYYDYDYTNMFEGRVKEFDMPCNIGSIDDVKGIYEGISEDDNIEGTYTGWIKNGEPNGNGHIKAQITSNITYNCNGIFKNGKLNGEGWTNIYCDRLNTPSNLYRKTREGTFVDDKLNGEGTYREIYKDKTVTYTGTFADDILIGQGEQKIEFTSGENKGYALIGSGEFENGTIVKGNIIIYDPSGNVEDSYTVG